MYTKVFFDKFDNYSLEVEFTFYCNLIKRLRKTKNVDEFFEEYHKINDESNPDELGFRCLFPIVYQDIYDEYFHIEYNSLNS